MAIYLVVRSYDVGKIDRECQPGDLIEAHEKIGDGRSV